MNETTIGLVILGVVTLVAFAMLLGLVTLKAINRRRALRRRERHTRYVALISRRIAAKDTLEPIDGSAVDDDAFLDAVIDIRNVVTGRQIDTLAGIIDGVGLARTSGGTAAQPVPSRKTSSRCRFASRDRGRVDGAGTHGTSLRPGAGDQDPMCPGPGAHAA